jgi:hypothetical protein
VNPEHRRTVGSAAWVRIQFSFHQKRFVSATMLSKPLWYTDLRQIFIERHGPPPKTRKPEYQTRMGVKTVGEVLVWIGDKVQIDFEQYAGSLTSTQASIALRSELARAAGRRPEEGPQEGAIQLFFTLY